VQHLAVAEAPRLSEAKLHAVLDVPNSGLPCRPSTSGMSASRYSSIRPAGAGEATSSPLPRITRSAPELRFSSRRRDAASPCSTVVLFRSASCTVREQTCFGSAFIASATCGSFCAAAGVGHQDPIIPQVRRPNTSSPPLPALPATKASHSPSRSRR